MKKQFLKVALALVFSVSFVQAHALYQSNAEVEYNPKTKKIEVSLTVFISHLEVALIFQTQREMRFEQTPAAELDAQIHRYLTKTFLVKDSAGTAAKIEWVGHKLDPDSAISDDPMVTIYFEIAMEEMRVGTQLRNTVFCEMFKDQINCMYVLNGAHRQSIHFDSSSGFVSLLMP